MEKKYIFLAGHHRSGTSLLHKVFREHPSVSGITNSGVPEDEGQHLQTVYKTARAHGGPGKYIYDEKSYMNEDHPLATEQSAKKIIRQWEPYLDTDRTHYIEKSPPNLIRTRFLQKLFPESKFVVILRHPVAVGFATRKWSRTSIRVLVEHSLRGYEIFMRDLPYLGNAYVVRYEDFVASPQEEIDRVYDFLDLEPVPVQHIVRPNINDKYLSMWRKNRRKPWKRNQFPITDDLEKRTNRFGYSIIDCKKLLPASIFGAHQLQA